MTALRAPLPRCGDVRGTRRLPGLRPGIALNDDPAVLSDGDRYRLTITDRNGSVVAAVDKTVVYRQDYPNGTDCDPYPCRWADVGP